MKQSKQQLPSLAKRKEYIKEISTIADKTVLWNNTVPLYALFKKKKSKKNVWIILQQEIWNLSLFNNVKGKVDIMT